MHGNLHDRVHNHQNKGLKKVSLEFIQEPILTMAFSALGGFIMKARALDSERRHQEHQGAVEAFMLAMTEGGKSAGLASKRAPDTWGKVTRRAIAWALVGSVVLLCFFPGFFSSPAIVQTISESSGWIFGLIPGGTKTEFQAINGFIHSPDLLLGFGHIIAFYFGQGAAKP